MTELLQTLQNLDPQKRALAYNHFLKTTYKASLASTAKDLLGYKDINPRTHKNPIQAIEENTKRKLIVMPRGTFKSSICSVSYPIWSLLKNPNLRILLDSEIYTNSKNFLREIKLHLESEMMTRIFGPFKTRECWNEGEIIIQQRTKILKEASITASGIGAEKTGQHYDLIICDDLNSPSNSHTQEGREKVIQHYRFLTSILEPEGTLAVVGTRYSADDCIGFILNNELGYSEDEKKEVESATKQPVYLVCGVPGSGKSWVCEQLTEKFNYVSNDKYMHGGFSHEIRHQALGGKKPVLADCPFGESNLRKELEGYGLRVIPIFIVEEPHVVRYQYEKRDGKYIPQQHLTRAKTIKDRAIEWKAPHGRAYQVLEMLKKV